MRARFILLFTAALACLASCTREQEERPNTFFCSVTEDVPSFDWHVGDRISVFNGDSGNKAFVFNGGNGEKGAEFKFDSGQDGEFSVPKNYAVYPWSESNLATATGTLYVDLPSSQGSSERPVMAACSEDAKLVFKPLCGILTVRLHGTGSIAEVTLMGNDSEKLAGKAAVEFAENGNPSVMMSAAGTSLSVTADCDPAIALDRSVDKCRTVSVFVPETSFKNGISLVITDITGSSTVIRSTEAVSVSRGRETLLKPTEVLFSHPMDARIGEPLPAWEEGWLDIHSINSGRGEAFFYIFPDGTTMLVDAAGATDFEIDGEDGSGIYSKPSQEYSSGTVINRYLQKYMPGVSRGQLDYFMLSHYHGDHMGSFTRAHAKYGWKAVDKNGRTVNTVDVNTGGFLLNGLPEVGMAFPISKLIDRGEWDNRASNVWSSGQLRRQNYLNFIDWSKRTHGTIREKLSIGNTDQIVLKHKPGQYPDFSVRGIAAGGDIWTGSGNSVNTTYVPSAADCLANADTWDINENIFSCVFMLKYGKFDWFSGGDIQYNDRSILSWKDIELPISKVVGKVEAMKASHHSTSSTNSSALLNVLKPDCYVVGVWTKNQPNYSTLGRLYSANKDVDIFATNLSGYVISILGSHGIDAGGFKARGGHVVLRVAPGGDQYYVHVLDDSDFEYRITEIHGPYSCK